MQVSAIKSKQMIVLKFLLYRKYATRGDHKNIVH